MYRIVSIIFKYRNFNNSYTNSKSEVLNSKQIRISKFKCSKHCFEFLSLKFRDCLGFSILKLGFSRAVAKLILIPLLLMATKYAGEFQELGVGGRACAMGGTGVAQFVDPSVIYFNPAGSFYADRGVLLMHAENFAGVVKIRQSLMTLLELKICFSTLMEQKVMINSRMAQI